MSILVPFFISVNTRHSQGVLPQKHLSDWSMDITRIFGYRSLIDIKIRRFNYDFTDIEMSMPKTKLSVKVIFEIFGKNICYHIFYPFFCDTEEEINLQFLSISNYFIEFGHWLLLYLCYFRAD